MIQFWLATYLSSFRSLVTTQSWWITPSTKHLNHWQTTKLALWCLKQTFRTWLKWLKLQTLLLVNQFRQLVWNSLWFKKVNPLSITKNLFIAQTIQVQINNQRRQTLLPLSTNEWETLPNYKDLYNLISNKLEILIYILAFWKMQQFCRKRETFPKWIHRSYLQAQTKPT